MVKLKPAPTCRVLSGRLLALLSAQHTRVWGIPPLPEGECFVVTCSVQGDGRLDWLSGGGRGWWLSARLPDGWGANYVSVLLFWSAFCMHVLKIAVRLVWRMCVS